MEMQKTTACSTETDDQATILQTIDLKVAFRIGGRELPVVDSVSLELKWPEHTALLGETGCGKSILALAILGLLPVNAFVEGMIRGLGHTDLLALPPKAINALRGRRMVFIPQNPHGSLNPVFRTKRQLAESIRLVHRDRPAGIMARVHDLLSRTGFTNPEKVAGLYPSQLSGGMAQRILISSALAGAPDLIIADEPTKGLDPAIADQCLNLLTSSFKDAAMLLITHDLAAAAGCDRAAVMYAGEIVECGPAGEVFKRPLHPYTRALIAAHPANGLEPIPGSAPGLATMPCGCRFHPRCAEADRRCGDIHPALSGNGQRWVRCFHAGS
jgi:peptide/nickel transport system ATP-binding protein